MSYDPDSSMRNPANWIEIESTEIDYCVTCGEEIADYYAICPKCGDRRPTLSELVAALQQSKTELFETLAELTRPKFENQF